MGLLADVDAALNEIYNLNDNEVEAMDNALIGIVGEGVDDLQDAIVQELGWAESPSGKGCNSQRRPMMTFELWSLRGLSGAYCLDF